MSGHSKWSTIKRKKEKTDQARAKIFTRIGRELAMVVRAGGPDPNVNGKLRDVIAKAKANNVPNDNIDRIIKKAAGEQGGAEYEQLIYEGYGPAGVAVIVETLTDNRNRTAGDMRHFFDKCGGNLGQSGSVMFMFEHKGLIVIDGEGLDEDKVMEDALEAGAADFAPDEGVYTVYTDPDDVASVAEALTNDGYELLSAQVEMVPQNTIKLTDEGDIKNLQKMLDMFEDNEDGQNVWHNWEE